MFTTGVFNKGQQYFVLSDSILRVVLIITYYSPLDNTVCYTHRFNLFCFCNLFSKKTDKRKIYP